MHYGVSDSQDLKSRLRLECRAQGRPVAGAAWGRLGFGCSRAPQHKARGLLTCFEVRKKRQESQEAKSVGGVISQVNPGITICGWVWPQNSASFFLGILRIRKADKSEVSEYREGHTCGNRLYSCISIHEVVYFPIQTTACPALGALLTKAENCSPKCVYFPRSGPYTKPSLPSAPPALAS